MKIIKSNKGFTLIELLVVIAIIGLLATIIIINLNNARNKAKYAVTQAILTQVRQAIYIMQNDTGYFPNACSEIKPIAIPAGPYGYQMLESPLYGIVKQPTPDWPVVQPPVLQNGYCTKWPNNIATLWKGPYYISKSTSPGEILDGWERPIFVLWTGNNPAFSIINLFYSSCSQITHSNNGLGLFYISRGADGIERNCDDVIMPIAQW